MQSGGAFIPEDSAHVSGVWTFDHLNLGKVEYAASGAIAVTAGLALITKASAAAMTLGAPAASQDGAVLVISSETAAAHTVTATALLADGVSGSPHGTATFAAYKGATLTLVAAAGLWNVQSAVGVTIA